MKKRRDSNVEETRNHGRYSGYGNRNHDAKYYGLSWRRIRKLDDEHQYDDHGDHTEGERKN